MVNNTLTIIMDASGKNKGKPLAPDDQIAGHASQPWNPGPEYQDDTGHYRSDSGIGQQFAEAGNVHWSGGGTGRWVLTA